jgi:hypothetical protein
MLTDDFIIDVFNILRRLPDNELLDFMKSFYIRYKTDNTPDYMFVGSYDKTHYQQAYTKIVDNAWVRKNFSDRFIPTDTSSYDIGLVDKSYLFGIGRYYDSMYITIDQKMIENTDLLIKMLRKYKINCIL